ncbi:DNA replication and repair protein RecN [Alicyclobacillus sacchari]|uniref:DNA repair protein RecN n=1 Tax=Alicyclobacillus sacchari TaxID=392010 RepID=A0A4V3HE20_9BACL|nr:DNA repair protein RecN [Alicyclobacillus sacchari]TDY43415.1 DNA replication and repair protein RecN [Alicyclobacillus sacchari]GMA55832.1 DNA repair protein RecN [Alicyclobacillus sacchari]
MLIELYVRNFVLIDELRLAFGKGLHVFTGETGAGKSLLLDATRAVLGARVSSQIVQIGADHALIEAVFAVADSPASLQLLEQWGIDRDDVLVVSRTVYANGRSQCRINGRAATVQMLRQLGETLVEMQDQHESVALVTPMYQRRLLDLYGRHRELLDATASTYMQWQSLVRELAATQVSERERAQQIDVCRFQIEEIERVNMAVGEDESLREERQRLLVAQKLRGHVDALATSLDDPRVGAIVQLATAEHEAAELAERVQGFAEIHELIAAAKIHVEEAAFAVSRYAGRLDVNPARLAQIEDRLAELRGLMRKYGSTAAEIDDYLQRAKTKLAELESYEQRVADLEQDVNTTEGRYIEFARRLHDARVETARRLQAKITEALRRLQMMDAECEITVHWQDDMRSEEGMDDVQFLFRANRGQPLLPLQKVASGGELSRTLLAVKVVVADLEHVETLVFDEIDAGVSGEAAQRVAELLRELGSDKQVLCVTHSPQVAAAGHVHFEILKEVAGDTTSTRVRNLNDRDRAMEIGRLLGAGVSDDTALRHACALLESFRRGTTIAN